MKGEIHMRRITKIYAFLFALIMVLSAAPLMNASALSTNYLLLDLIIKKPTDISTCTIAVAKSVSYTGKALKPKVTVKDGKNVLKEGTHYTLKYSSNKKIGTGKVTVTGIDNKGYKNSKTISFKIGEIDDYNSTWDCKEYSCNKNEMFEPRELAESDFEDDEFELPFD